MFRSSRFGASAIVALMLFGAAGADAAVCARGVYRAGCAGPNGAVGVRRGYVAPRAVVVTRPVPVVIARPVVVAPAPVIVARRPVVVAAPVRCAWINGRRVCR